jgi:predicted MFS family arabinose efflux permease
MPWSSVKDAVEQMLVGRCHKGQTMPVTLSKFATGSSSFVRDRSTVLSYCALATFTYLLYGFGPMLSFLREELHFSYTLISVHTSLWSAGAVVTGLVFDRFSRRVGRRRLFWLSAAGVVVGAVLLMVANTVWLTLLSAAMLGTVGTTVLVSTSVILADRHGERRDRALVEANIGASATAVVVPAILGFLHGTPAGWRMSLLIPVIAMGVIFLLFRQTALPMTPPQAHGSSVPEHRLPAEYLLFALLAAVSVGIEFCVIYYGAELLRVATGISTASSATAMSLFFVGALAGRVLGSGLTRRPGRAVAVIFAALCLTMVGFLAFWLAGGTTVRLTGLFVAGLGVANLYPLTLAMAIAAAPGHTDRATARVQVLGGLVMAAAPFALGSLADHIGIQHAYVVEPVLIAIALVLLATGHTRVRSNEQVRRCGGRTRSGRGE